MPTYRDRTDPTKEYEAHLFVPARGLQAAELNEIQTTASNSLKRVAETFLKDGNIIRDCQIFVAPSTGVTTLGSGAMYIAGRVRDIPAATFTLPTTGTVSVGVRLVSSVVTAIQDPTLYDLATETVNFGKAGADRRKLHAQWGWDGDGVVADYYPVYTVVDGQLNVKDAPPELDAVSSAIARYDRDSAGGCYVVSGLEVKQLADDVDGKQVYTMAEGRARVFGSAIEFATARRIKLTATPDLKAITNEPHLSATVSAQRIDFNHSPGTNITELTITAQKTVSLVHGVTTGAQDPLPDTSVLQIISVVQGGTTYTEPTDYLLTSDKVNWSPAGAEPAPGSTYDVTYRYLKNVTPTAVDDKGFTVTGAVVGTIIQASYSWKLPRIDRLCLNADGSTVWLIGVSAEYNPQPPAVPPSLLALASIRQTWDANRIVGNDGVRVVPMPVLANIDARLDLAMQLIAQNRLESSIHTREGGTKLGLFTDPFLDDSQRDAGLPQTCAVVSGELVLPITSAVLPVSADLTQPLSLNYAPTPVLVQSFRTTDMKINPYMAFAAVPATVTLVPNVDRWTLTQSNWMSESTSRFVIGSGDQASVATTTRTALLSTTTSNIETLRPVTVSFSIAGFGPGEVLTKLTFDGQDITPTAI